MEFSRQEHWSRLSFPSPGDLLNPGIELVSPAPAGFFTTETPGKAKLACTYFWFSFMDITYSFISLRILNIFSYLTIVCEEQFTWQNINYSLTPDKSVYKHCTVIFFSPTKQRNLEDISLSIYRVSSPPQPFFLVKVLTCLFLGLLFPVCFWIFVRRFITS